jgi:hypothetical protein
MKRLAWVLTATVIALTACSASESLNTGALSPAEEAEVAAEVRQVAEDYTAAYSKISCENQDAVLKFFDWSGPGVVDVSATDVKEYPGSAWPTLIRDAACSRESEQATIGKLVIRVVSRDVAVASSTFEATYPQKAGPTKRARGALMQVWRRNGNGWKTSVGMSTHEYLPPQ